MKKLTLQYCTARAGFCAVAFCLLSGTQVLAQPLPGPADPGRVQQQLSPPAIVSPLPEFVPPSAEVDESLPPRQVDDGFVLTGLHITGVTAFSEGRLHEVYKDAIGQEVDFISLENLAHEITRLYRQNGYILSRAFLPEQEIVDGVVHFEVIEGYIADITVSDESKTPAGSKDYLNILQGFKKKIMAMRPLHGPTLERYLLLLDDLGGTKMQGILDRGSDMLPGALSLILHIETEAPDLSLFVNNHGSRYVGPYQTGFYVGHTTPFLDFDHISFSTAFSVPMDSLQHISMRYQLPLSASGLGMIFRTSWSNTVPGYNLRDLDVQGRAQHAALDLYYPLIRSRSKSLQISGGFDFKNVRTDILGERISRDRIRAVRLSMDYAASDRWQGVSFLGLNIGHGMNVMGASKPDDPNLSRASGRPDFTKIGFTASRQQFLPRGLQLDVRLMGQFSEHPLLSSEEFGFGGAQWGRGYDSSEITGDRGLAASFQLSYNDLPPWSGIKLQPMAFYDIGRVWNVDKAAGVNQSAAAAGIGVNFNTRHGLDGQLVLAVPLTRPVSTPLYGGKKDARVLFQISYGF